MKDKADRLASRWLSQIELDVRRVAAHPFAFDVATVAGVAVLSIFGLATQDRLGPTTAVFCLLLCAPLLLHRRDPRVCFALVALVAFTQWLISAPQLADAAVLISLYCVALESDLEEVAVAATVVQAGAILAAVRWSPSEPLKIWVGLTGLAAAAGVSGITIRQRRALLISLHERATRLEVERDQEGRLAAAAERARIAREMHDIVAHNLSVMISLADGAGYAMASSPQRADEAIARISATGRQALLEMRRLLGVLGEDAAEQPLAPQPRLDRLDELLAQVHAAGIPVTMDLDGDPRELPEGIQLTIFRVAQEALTNTLKHAARPTSAHVALSCAPRSVELEVTDTGRSAGLAGAPAPLAGSGRGLSGMRERAAAYGGKLDAGPGLDGGWRVHLRLRPDAEAVTP
ncbi:MAG TPA: histidine kinase [Solirubrobacteraceae bacterium]|jgi:signal transduction histidine kinase|nr:histidine kinase [Solirubrobacteraceae bacterium]